MISILHSLLILFTLSIIIIAFGSFFSKPSDEPSFGKPFLLGFLLLYLISYFIVLPMTLLRQSLSDTTVIWAFVVFGLTIFAFIYKRKVCFNIIKSFFIAIKKIRLPEIIALGLFAFQLIIVLGFSYTDYDDTFYTGTISTAVYTDTMYIYDPYTGFPLEILNSRYAIATYPMTSAVMCNLFSLHPLLLTRIVLPILLLFISNLIFYKIGQEFWPNSNYAPIVFLIMATVVNLFGNSSIYTPSRFLYTRISQGKTILCNILIPLVILFALKIFKKPNEKKYWVYMLMVTATCSSFSTSSMYIIPATLASFAIPFAITSKSLKIFRNFLICSAPCIAVISLYYLLIAGYIIL